MLYSTTSSGNAYQNNSDAWGSVFSLNMGLGSFLAFVQPAGRGGQTARILGQGLTGTTAVTFSGVAATKFTVVSDTHDCRRPERRDHRPGGGHDSRRRADEQREFQNH